MLKTLVICLLFAGTGWAGDLAKLCKDKKTVPFAEKFVKESLGKGMMHINLMQKLPDDAAVAGLFGEPKKDTRKWAKTVCYQIKFGLLSKDGSCNYNDTNYISCTGLGGMTDELDESWLVKTDNKTYMTMIGCAKATKPFWRVLGNIPSLPPNVEAEILTYLETLGFDKKDSAPQDETLKGTKLHAAACKSKDAAGGLPDVLGLGL